MRLKRYRMRRTAQVGGIAAEPGQKVTGFLEVPGAGVALPITLVVPFGLTPNAPMDSVAKWAGRISRGL